MASTFMGLSIAGRGLSASQTGLATTANNMSNINTTGYSRQVVNQVSIGPAAVYSNNNKVGSGTEVTSVDRVRSFRLDQKYWQENGALGEWEAKSTYLQELETLFGGTDDSFSTTMSEFYDALEDLSTDMSSSAQAVVLETGAAVCQYLNDAAERIASLRSDVNGEVKTAVEQINSYAQQIASLNQQISVATASGTAANELKDQRDALIDKLSAIADIDVVQDGESYTITIAGATLVSGNKAKELECYTITDGSSQDGMYGIRWANSGESFDVGKSGSLKAYLDLRDGATAGNKGLLYYSKQLDTFAQTFAKAFNEGIYADGSTSSYSGHAAAQGIRFFSYDGLSSDDLLASGSTTDEIYANITAANISLSADVQNNTGLIASSGTSDEEGNNQYINDLISICSDKAMFATGTPEDFYNSVISTLGTASSYAQKQYDLQTNITTYIDNSRASVAGVSTDEETANMTKYQSAYDASAQMISTWNQIYATTINMVSSD